MWTSLEKNETRPDVVGSGVLEPGDCVFFNPTHPHRGPQEPFLSQGRGRCSQRLRRRLSTPPARGCPTRLEIAPAALAEPSWVPDGLTAVKTYWSKHLLKRQYANLPPPSTPATSRESRPRDWSPA